MKKNNYNNESITSLKGADRVRLRPSVIFGSDGIIGCRHAFFEILSNSIDEARQGFGNVIEIVKYKDYSISIKDYGRGIPVDYNENENVYNYELVFCELYAGGKYNNNDNNADVYEYSLGLNGLGLCATQYASEYMIATINRDGYLYNLNFEKGNNVGGLKKEKSTENKSYSYIKWKPDTDVFTDINIPLDYFLDVLKKQAVVNPSLTLKLYDEESDETYVFAYEKGIVDYIDELAEQKNFTDIHYLTHECVGKDRADKPEYKLKFELGFCFTNEKSIQEYYHNSSYLEYGGSPDKAMKNAFLWAIDNYIKENNLYKKDDKKIMICDIEDCLIYISNSFSTVTSYENQTKKAITNKFIQEAMTTFLKNELKIYFIENKVEADKLVTQVLINKRSREQSEKTRINIKKKLTGSIDISNRVNKYVDCRTKDKTKKELYIVEGDSALGACKLGRDGEFQAIMPVRGKILNCLKADYNKIFKSEIITDLIKVLGCGVELEKVKDMDTFNLDNLNFSKVIICTDADVDGFQIRTLILTMLYRLVPTLINERKVYIAQSPLYEITSGKKTYFAYDEPEKNKIVKNLKTYKLQRSKGLGENEPDMMWQTTMNPKTRRLISVEPEEINKTKEMFEILLGDNIDGRKKFIKEKGSMYLDISDIK